MYSKMIFIGNELRYRDVKKVQLQIKNKIKTNIIKENFGEIYMHHVLFKESEEKLFLHYGI